MRQRRIVSITLMVMFAFVAITGIQMHSSTHNGHDQHMTASNAISFEKSKVEGKSHSDTLQKPSKEDNFILERLHEWAGYLLVILGVIHLVINRKLMLAYIGLRK